MIGIHFKKGKHLQIVGTAGAKSKPTSFCFVSWCVVGDFLPQPVGVYSDKLSGLLEQMTSVAEELLQSYRLRYVLVTKAEQTEQGRVSRLHVNNHTVGPCSPFSPGLSGDKEPACSSALMPSSP